jgi:hypothetical protein
MRAPPVRWRRPQGLKRAVFEENPGFRPKTANSRTRKRRSRGRKRQRPGRGLGRSKVLKEAVARRGSVVRLPRIIPIRRRTGSTPPLSRIHAVGFGERTRLACCRRRPAVGSIAHRRLTIWRSIQTKEHSRRGAANHTRGRVCSPKPTAEIRLSGSAFTVAAA